MMGLPASVRIWLAAGVTDLRKGFDGLSALVQTALGLNPYSGQIFVFRGRRGDRIKILWDTQDGLCLFYKRLRGGKFVWPKAESGTVSLSAAQLSMLLEGIDWRQPKRTGLAPQDTSSPTRRPTQNTHDPVRTSSAARIIRLCSISTHYRTTRRRSSTS
jgi:transposase